MLTTEFNPSNGFLPSQDPIQKLPKACEAWETLASQLPKLLISDQTRQTIEHMPPFPLDALTTSDEFERAMLILSYLGHAYVWNNNKPADRIPERLAVPWHAVAKQIGRPPVLSYASYALNNWKRLDRGKPIQLGNIALLQNFLGGIDEEWFILIHVDIENKAAEAIRSLIPAQMAAQEENAEQLQQYLVTIAESLENICTTLDRMPEHCDPYIYYNRVRPYIHGWKDNVVFPNGLIYEGVAEYSGIPQKFKGETGAQSTIIPALDATLNITHKDNPLKQHLMEMRNYMPPQHRKFLETLDKGTSVREFVKQNRKKYQSLRDTYNNCIKLIARFRKTHLSYAAHYIQKQIPHSEANPTEIGTGGTPFMAYLKKHKKETERQLI